MKCSDYFSSRVGLISCTAKNIRYLTIPADDFDRLYSVKPFRNFGVDTAKSGEVILFFVRDYTENLKHFFPLSEISTTLSMCFKVTIVFLRVHFTQHNLVNFLDTHLVSLVAYRNYKY